MSRLRAIWRLLNTPCEGMSRLASESFDRDLGRLERFALRSHLLYCAACRRYRRQLEVLRYAMRRLARDAEADVSLPGPALPEAVRERIKQALKSH